MHTAGKVLSVILLLLALLFLWLSSMTLQLRRNWAERIQRRQEELSNLQNEIEQLKYGRPEAVSALEQVKNELRDALDRFFESDAPQRLLEQRRRWSEIVAEPDLAQPQEVDEIYRSIQQIQNELDQLANTIEEKFQQLLTEVARASRTDGGLGSAQIREIIPLVNDAATAIETWRRDRQAIYESLTAFYENQRLVLGRQIRTVQEANTQSQAELDRLREQLLPLDQVQIAESDLRSELRDHPVLQLTAQDLERQPFARLRETLRTPTNLQQLSFVEHVRALLELMQADLVQIREILQQRQEQLSTAIQQRDSLIQENKSLVARVSALEAEVDAREGNGTYVVTADGKIPQGEIVEIQPENFQVVVNLGRKDGLRPRVKLHVYRTDPSPRYLGMIEIEEVYEDRSTGVILPAYRDLSIRKGDKVASVITQR